MRVDEINSKIIKKEIRISVKTRIEIEFGLGKIKK